MNLTKNYFSFLMFVVWLITTMLVIDFCSYGITYANTFLNIFSILVLALYIIFSIETKLFTKWDFKRILKK